MHKLNLHPQRCNFAKKKFKLRKILRALQIPNHGDWRRLAAYLE
jgi:hypothetical protein